MRQPAFWRGRGYCTSSLGRRSRDLGDKISFFCIDVLIQDYIHERIFLSWVILENMQQSFRRLDGTTLPYPLFFPDATRGVVKAVDNEDVVGTGTPGILVNTYHLWRTISEKKMRAWGGIRPFMHWRGAVISDSGGFQAMSLIKKAGGKITNEGLWFKPPNSAKVLLTPEISIRYQLALQTDLVVVLDEYTHEDATKREERVSVERTIAWAKRSKVAYDEECERLEIREEKRPYLIAVNQGGKNLALRRECNERLAEIGFDGYGHGGDGFDAERRLDMELSQIVVTSAPKDAVIYGLGVGKPEDIVRLSAQGYQIFDCVIPTRDGRHGRLYVFNAKTAAEIDLTKPKFYHYYVPTKTANHESDEPISSVCDCHTCTHYSRAYLAHLFKIGDTLAYRLATIHNLRFYAILMERLRG